MKTQGHQDGRLPAGSRMVSAIDRLRALPEIFRGGEVTVLFQWTSKKASHYLYLWKQRGLIEPLGGHSDVFVNLLANPRPDWSRALQMAMPSAVVVGVEALRRAGWITQIPGMMDVAVEAGSRVFATNRFSVTTRTKSWFRTTATACEGDRTLAPPTLRPAWALADLFRQASLGSSGATHAPMNWCGTGLQPDDIEWYEIGPDDQSDWAQARRQWRLAAPADLRSLSCDPRGLAKTHASGRGRALV